MVQTSADPRVQQKVLEKKREILDAASRVFRRRGLQSTGMRDIAAELGMAVGNLYYYFKDKEELLAFVQEGTLEGLLDLAVQVRKNRLPADAQGHVVLLNEGIPGSLAHLEVEALREPWRPEGSRSVDRGGSRIDRYRRTGAAGGETCSRSSYLVKDAAIQVTVAPDPVAGTVIVPIDDQTIFYDAI